MAAGSTSAGGEAAPAGSAGDRVVIVGGGFAGMACAHALRRSRARVTLIDRRNFHLFQPLLYQVASGGLSPANIAAPLRSIFRRQRNVQVLMGNVSGFDFASRRVLLDEGDAIPFDTLVVAGGSRHHYFGRDAEWGPMAPGLKTIEDATLLRHRLLSAFERAERTDDPVQRAAELTFVVVGGGPTGVEMAGAIAELAHQTLRKDFRAIDPATARVILVESGDRVLDTYAPELSAAALTALESLGAEVWRGRRVVELQPGHVVVRDRAGTLQRIDTATVVWAAGVRASELGGLLAAALGRSELLDKGGRVVVDERCMVADAAGVYVLGDLASFATPDGGTLPGVAPVAMQQGAWVGRRIACTLAGHAHEGGFRYHDKGSMATIGRSRAIVEAGRWRLTGRLAWLVWLCVHILYLARFENRVLVSLQWFWSYVTRNRSARLITGGDEMPPAHKPG